MKSYSSERERKRQIDVSELDIQEEFEADENIQNNNLCRPYGIRSMDDFPVMKTFRKWRPYDFNKILQSDEKVEITNKDFTLNNAMGFIYKYINTVQLTDKYIFILPENAVKYTKYKNNIITELEPRFIRILEDNLKSDSIQTIIIPVSIYRKDRDKEYYESTGYIFIYKKLNTIECFHPEFEDFFESSDGEILLELLANRPLNEVEGYELIQEFKIVSLKSNLSNKNIIDEFLEIYPFVQEKGYIRRTYHSFRYLWSIFMMLFTRIITKYNEDEVKEINEFNFDILPSRFRNNVYTNFYIFLQCFSSYLWENLPKRIQEYIQLSS